MLCMVAIRLLILLLTNELSPNFERMVNSLRAPFPAK